MADKKIINVEGDDDLPDDRLSQIRARWKVDASVPLGNLPPLLALMYRTMIQDMRWLINQAVNSGGGSDQSQNVEALMASLGMQVPAAKTKKKKSVKTDVAKPGKLLAGKSDDDEDDVGEEEEYIE